MLVSSHLYTTFDYSSTLCNDEAKLNFIIAHIDGPTNTQQQKIAAQGYKKAIKILSENESLLKQMKQAPSLISILDRLAENINLIKQYISLGFKPQSMGLILFIQRGQLRNTFKILEENVSLFQNKLKYFPEDELTQRLLEQNDKIGTFGMRVELLKTEQTTQSLSLASAAARRILCPQRTGQIPNSDPELNFSLGARF